MFGTCLSTQTWIDILIFFWEFRLPIRKVWHRVFFLYDKYLHMTNRTLLLSNVLSLSLKKCQQLARTATIECKLECKQYKKCNNISFSLCSHKRKIYQILNESFCKAEFFPFIKSRMLKYKTLTGENEMTI